MTIDQLQMFQTAAGFSASRLSFEIKLLVGGITLIAALLILTGLMHLLNSNSSWEKTVFITNVFMLSFVLMLIFIYCA